MAQIVEESSWYSSIAKLSTLLFYLRSIMRMISWVFITLALAFALPILGLILYDFALWIWRLCLTQPSITVPPGQTIPTNSEIPGTSKSQVSGADLEQARIVDKPASD